MVHSILNFDFKQLSVDERYELMCRIWESLQDEDTPVPLSQEQIALLEQRFREMEEHPERALSWEEFHEQVFKTP